MISLGNLIKATFRWGWDSRIDPYERGIIIRYPELVDSEITHLYYFPRINEKDYNIIKVMVDYTTKYALIDEESFTDEDVTNFLEFIHKNEKDLETILSVSDYQRQHLLSWIYEEVTKDLEDWGAVHDYFNALRDKRLLCNYGFNNDNFIFDKEENTLYQYICVPLPTAKVLFIRISTNGKLGINTIDYGTKGKTDSWNYYTDVGELKKAVEGKILIEQLNCLNNHIMFSNLMKYVTGEKRREEPD